MTRYGRRSIALAVALSALAGYVDATGYLATGGFFVSFMSGNSTRLGLALGQGRLDYAFLASSVIGLFVVGVILGSLVAHRAGERRKTAILGSVGVLLSLAAAAHALAMPRLGTAAVVLAMGAENATFQREGEVSIGLTYMTGTLVKLGQRIASGLHGGPKWAFAPYALLWIGLVAGATLGALVHARLSERALWPAGVVAFVLAAMASGVRPSPSHNRSRPWVKQTSTVGGEPAPPDNIGDGTPIAFTRWSGMRKGTGSLIKNGQKTKLSMVRIELKPGGVMTILPEEDRSKAINGTWKRRDGKTVALTVPGVATGTLFFMDLANPYRLNLKGQRLQLEFRVLE